MRGAMITAGSLALTAAVIGNAYYQKKQFYPSVVYITKSNPSMAVIYLQALVLVVLMGKVMRKLFFGQLRAAELEHLIERSWYAVTETCLAFTVFRDDFSPKFVALFTLLLFQKCFHWLADDRVDYMERSPVISLTFHVRVIALLSVLLSLDAHFVSLAYYSTLTKGASVQLVFGFEYAILLTIVCNIFIKYVLHTIDLQSGNPWENKAVYLLYTELIMGFIKVMLYITFVVIMMKVHTFPLFAIRPMYLTLRSFKKALHDVIMSRRAIRNMNTLYPDATPEELASVDNVCIICRDEMFSASKKLPCNHIFHTSCLRSWFQRQQTCPTCRMDVLQTSQQQQQQQQQQHAQPQPGAQPPAGPATPGGNLTPQQPQQPNILPFLPGPFPAGFPAWPQFPAPFQIPRPAASGEASPSAAGTSEVPGQQSATFVAGSSAPSAFSPIIPPFPFMPLVTPPPRPPPNFSGLTEDELRAMEGQERANVEARIQVLRNIQTLLDAAIVEMQQYSAVVASLQTIPNIFQTASQPSPVEPVIKTETKEPGPDKDQSPQDKTDSSSNEPVDDAGASASSPADDEKEQLRRRRLQRFGENVDLD